MKKEKASVGSWLWSRECECRREPKKEVGEKGLADATIKYGVNSPGGFPGQLWLLGFAQGCLCC